MGRDRVIEAAVRFLAYINVPATREDILEAADCGVVTADTEADRIIKRNIFAALSEQASSAERRSILMRDVPTEHKESLVNAWESWMPK